ncbi:MAG TPA: peptide chain release factor-like protein, partial [bacterium]|nr:peptide chain release factor-like protein [bacterium]
MQQGSLSNAEIRERLGFSDDQLMRECELQPYQASGPGGQKRNRTYSAVRLQHHPTGISVTAAESRSQLDNRHKALKRLRETIV